MSFATSRRSNIEKQEGLLWVIQQNSEGGLVPDRPFSEEITNYINRFSKTRHFKRNTEKIKSSLDGWEKHSYHGNLGCEGEYFVNDGMEHDELGKILAMARENSPKAQKEIMDYNIPPEKCPGLWCQWEIRDGKVVWDNGEKFYHYTEWLEYLITNFFAPEGYVLNGEIRWQGEDMDDNGTILVHDNKITIRN